MSFQAATGIDWKPGVEVPGAASSSASLGADIDGKIKAQGDAVRKLKSAKADKAEVDAAVKLLLQLKADFKAATGNDWKPAAALAAGKKPGVKVGEKNLLAGAIEYCSTDHFSKQIILF